MGRPKTYARDDVTRKAMRLFWERGYHATSTRDLTEAMGVNPYSLYAEFGSKEALYEAAIARYEDEVVRHHFGRLETPASSLADVRAVLDAFGRAAGEDNPGLGCLLCNASTELAPTVEGSRASTARFVARVTAAFRNALGNAVANGELCADSPIDALAAMFTTLLMGVFVLLRARVDADQPRAAVRQAIRHLDALASR